MVNRTLLVILIALAVVGGWLLWGRGSIPSSSPAPRDDSERAGEGAPEATLKGVAPDAPSSEPPPQEAHGAPADASKIVIATGRIVDEERRPVPAADIVLSFDGVEAARTRSDAMGSISIPLGVRPRVHSRVGELRVRAGTRGADRTVWLIPDGHLHYPLGSIMIAPLRELTVRALRNGAPVPNAEVALRQMEHGDPRLVLASGRTGREGTIRFDGLAASKVGVFAVADGTGRAFEQLVLPRGDVLDLELPDDRTATITVVQAPGDEPVEGAEVYLSGEGTAWYPRGRGCLPPLPPIRTDADGRAVVSGLPKGYVQVGARAPGLAMRNSGMHLERVSLGPEQDEATVTLYAYRTVRFPVRDRGSAPPEGTVLEVRRYQPLPGYDVGEPEARIEDGHLVLAPFPPGHDWGHVVSPDGRWALWRVPMDKDLGEPIDFGPIHDVGVRLKWRDGAPAVGEVLWAILRPRGRGHHLRTDKEGLAVFADCVAESATVMWTAVDGGFGMPIVRVPLNEDPEIVEVEIDRPIDIAVRMQISGVAVLPKAYEVRVPDMDPDRSGMARGRQVTAREIEEDPESGEVRFRWIPLPGGEPPPVTIRVEGYPGATATPVADGDGVWRATVELEASTTFRVRVEKPEGLRYYMFVERWNEDDQHYYPLHNDPAYQEGMRAVDGVYTFRGFTPGRYRLRDHYSGTTSNPFDLVPGGDAVDLTFDLTGTLLVRGRVVAPEGARVAFATVHIEDRRNGDASIMNPARVGPEGSFEFRSQTGARHRLVVKHPFLRLAEAAHEYTVGASELILHLVAGPELVFRLEGSDYTTPAPDPRVSGPTPGPIRIQMARAGEWSADSRWTTAIATDGLFRLGVPGDGVWSVCIQRHGFTPHLLKELTVGDGPKDLGTLAFEKGATLDVRLLKGKAALPELLGVRAKLVGDVSYEASTIRIQPGDPPYLRVEGLGPGTFEVSVAKLMTPKSLLLEQEVYSDGATPIVLDLQLP